MPLLQDLPNQRWWRGHVTDSWLIAGAITQDHGPLLPLPGVTRLPDTLLLFTHSFFNGNTDHLGQFHVTNTSRNLHQRFTSDNNQKFGA